MSNNTPKKPGSSKAGRSPNRKVEVDVIVTQPSRNKNKKLKTNNRNAQRMTAPVATATSVMAGKPKISRASNGTDVNIVHKEFYGNLALSQVEYQVQEQISINPGLEDTFPWLSKIARNFEYYRFRKLRIVFITRTGTDTAGSVLISPDYDAADPAPTSEQIQSSYKGTVEDAPWKDIICVLNPKDMFTMGPKKFVRTGTIGGTSDIKTYDAAQVFIATVGALQSEEEQNWGKIWIEYEVELSVPALHPDPVPTPFIAWEADGGGTFSTENLFGTDPTIAYSGDQPFTYSTDTITFSEAFQGLAVVHCAGAGGTIDTLIAQGTIEAPAMVFANDATEVMGYLPFTATVGDTLSFAITQTGSFVPTVSRIMIARWDITVFNRIATVLPRIRVTPPVKEIKPFAFVHPGSANSSLRKVQSSCGGKSF